MQQQTASREVLWNLSHPFNSIAMYLLLVASIAVCTAGLWMHFRRWAAGKSDPSRLNHWGRRFELIWNDVLLQRGVNAEAVPGRMHSLILWGFMVLLFTTTMVFIDHDLGIRIYNGDFYLAVTLLSDLFGLLLLFGVLMASHRRYVQRPDRLHNRPADAILLGALAALVMQGFLLEALRIHATNDPWKWYSPVGLLVSLPFAGLSETATRTLHFGIWWLHTITVFTFIALLPYTKFLHILASSANLFFRQISRPKGALPHPGDIEKLMETAMEADGEFRIGVSTLSDLSWKQRLDLDACTSCGRCQDNCPAYRSGKILSPKWLILDLRDHMLLAEGAHDRVGQLDHSLLKSFLLKDRSQLPRDEEGRIIDESRAANPLVQRAAKSIGENVTAKIPGEVLDEDVFWSCTTCRACMEVCPVGIEHVDIIVEARRAMALMDGNIPTEAQAPLRAIETRGNPFGPAAERANWADGLGARIVAPGEKVDVLYWVGCISSYDKRKQKIARSLAQIFNAAGLDWGILGESECCSGDPARRLGEENLFQSLAKKNSSTLDSVGFNTLVSNCPHCFNTIKNEYPEVVASAKQFRVLHHTQFVQELLNNKKIEVRGMDRELTFHDPCYLGRYNDGYEEPRDVLVKLGSKVREMRDSKERGLCCGAGGGHYWFDMKVGQRVNVLRTEQAAETGVSLVATGCPFCLQMMEDGSKLTNREETLAVKDIAELVAESLVTVTEVKMPHASNHEASHSS
ncbi:MAG: (Fe-S)-binding protein [Deltaproteobacteria bacterium]|nr:(Fe-S)-binding protein [Deltaproteobacteria bacterium]